MRRIATVALLAAPLLLGTSSVASAHDGPRTFGLGWMGWGLQIFPRIHQHGPLFNYGPYYGYPPFEPYGYWNSYLQYTGPVPPPNYNGAGAGAYGWIHGGYGWGAGHGHQLFHGGHGKHGHHKSGGCSSCEAAAEGYVTSGIALDRYNGVGSAAASGAYYAETPALLSPGAVVPVSGLFNR